MLFSGIIQDIRIGLRVSGREKGFCTLTVLLLVLGCGLPGAARAAEEEFSGVTGYAFEANPAEITPKLFNWEIRLSQVDSKAGAFEIVQLTTPLTSDQKPAAPVVLVAARVIAPDREGIIAFALHIGDKEPHPNMGRQGYSGEPVIFSGRGTANAQSGWIVLPGSIVAPARPAAQGTPLVDGRIALLQFTVTNARGARYRTDVIFRREMPPGAH